MQDKTWVPAATKTSQQRHFADLEDAKARPSIERVIRAHIQASMAFLLPWDTSARPTFDVWLHGALYQALERPPKSF